MKMKKYLLINLAIGMPTLFGLALASTLALYVKDNTNSGGSYGEIALRSYFECGSGKADDPYVITRPRHLYNLSRLQGLGVFANHDEAHFQLGLEDLGGYEYGCYAADYGTQTVPFLDMSASSRSYEPINAIGSESTPFYGEFNGKGLEIKNLNVWADPEDAGLFGYTAHGSNVHDLFLDNVVIHTSGYSSAYSTLYDPEASAFQTAEFSYLMPGSQTPILFDIGEHSDGYDLVNYPVKAYFDWDGEEATKPVLPTNVPAITLITPAGNPNGFSFKMLPSGSFIKVTSKTTATINLEDVFDFFKKKRNEIADTAFPLKASSSISMVASKTDSYGLDHSRVVMTLEFNFELSSKTENTLSMQVHLGKNHRNNIGLIIGHCDGSVKDCYVSKGSFVMNDSGETFTPMSNSSHLGLIGLVGGTVFNQAAIDSDTSTIVGKDVGVLDFTKIFDEIAPTPGTNFPDNSNVPYSFNPNTDSKYLKYLRHDNSYGYVTNGPNQISFKGQTVIKENELGVFTVATDHATTGEGGGIIARLDYSMIEKENTSIGENKDYYVYYATGEYNAAFHGNNGYKTGYTFADYRDSFNSDTPTAFFAGHHLPTLGEITSKSFDQREAHQNYIFRMQLTPAARKNRGFYFSDVDRATPGGQFISDYFRNKLVDQDGYPILSGGKCGLMLRDAFGNEQKSFSSSYTTANLSDGSSLVCLDKKPKGFVGQFDPNNSPVANAINFEIKTEYANVTVVAAPQTRGTAAALGVYRLDADLESTSLPNGDYVKSQNNIVINQNFDQPDYAFFMPRDEKLAYFDYKVESGVGQIGTYDDNGDFIHATRDTSATMPKEFGYGEEHGYEEIKRDDEGNVVLDENDEPIHEDKPRLFAHTFKLKKGRYCFGSPTGPNSYPANDPRYQSLSVAKVYYVCAQGQDDGQITFDDNVFASNDMVDDIDFIMQPRFTITQDQQGNITNISENIIQLYYDEDNHLSEYYIIPLGQGQSSDNTKYLWKKRCYVALVNEDPASTFAATATEQGKTPNIHFEYTNSVFEITSDSLSAMTRVAVNSYRHKRTDDFGESATNIMISIFGGAATNKDEIIYTAPVINP